MTATVKYLARFHANWRGCWALLYSIMAFAGFTHGVIADTNSVTRDQLLAYAQEVFTTQLKIYEAQPTNNVAAWKFAHAAFARGEFSTNDTERAAIAVQGISACRKLIQRDPKSTQGYYYLGLNLGQLARTKLLGALPLVREMESSFQKARELDEKFDYAGPHRFGGQLYLQAPGWSVGSQSKARKHLERAVELAPNYPENRLNLAEAALRWRDKKLEQRELEALQKLWPAAKTNFTGADWDAFWVDWQPRYDKLTSKPPR